MWKMYSNNDTGYCIEYEVPSNNTAEYLNHLKNIFPVIYSNKPTIDIIELIQVIFSSILFSDFSSKKMVEEINKKITRVFTTKSKEWSFQDEWRLFGEPNDKVSSFPIKSIYLGKRVSNINKKKMKNLCKKNNIILYQAYDDYKELKVKFYKIEL